MVRGFLATPPDPKLEEAKAKFAAINEHVTEAGGWLVSVPGDPTMRLQVLPGSPLPGELIELGYLVTRTGETQRILPMAIAQPMTLSSSGALVAATEGSTRPVTMVVTSAGLATVETYDLRVP
jgi:hypothetical protein